MKNVSETFHGATVEHVDERVLEDSPNELARNHFYLPLSATKAAVIAFHGYSGHSRQSDMKHLANELRREWYQVTSFDLPNHGQSVTPEREQYRGQVPSFGPIIRAIHGQVSKTLVTQAKLAANGKKSLDLCLVGYSLGAIGILRFLQKFPQFQPYVRIILINPAFDVDENARKFLEEHPVLGKVAPYLVHAERKDFFDYGMDIVSRFWPDIPMAELQARDPNDKLEFQEKISMKTSKTLRQESKRARREMPRITCSMLIIQANDDKVTNPKASVDAFRRAGTPDGMKSLLTVDADHHSVEKSIQHVVAWLNAHNTGSTMKRLKISPGLINDAVNFTSVFARLLLDQRNAFRRAFVDLFVIFRDMLKRWSSKIESWTKHS